MRSYLNFIYKVLGIPRSDRRKFQSNPDYELPPEYEEKLQLLETRAVLLASKSGISCINLKNVWLNNVRQLYNGTIEGEEKQVKILEAQKENLIHDLKHPYSDLLNEYTAKEMHHYNKAEKKLIDQIGNVEIRKRTLEEEKCQAEAAHDRIITNLRYIPGSRTVFDGSRGMIFSTLVIILFEGSINWYGIEGLGTTDVFITTALALGFSAGIGLFSELFGAQTVAGNYKLSRVSAGLVVLLTFIVMSIRYLAGIDHQIIFGLTQIVFMIGALCLGLITNLHRGFWRNQDRVTKLGIGIDELNGLKESEPKLLNILIRDFWANVINNVRSYINDKIDEFHDTVIELAEAKSDLENARKRLRTVIELGYARIQAAFERGEQRNK